MINKKIILVLCTLTFLVGFFLSVCFSAEFLVKTSSSFTSGGYEKWDIVVVREDGFQWGGSERLPKFYLIKIANLPVNNSYEESVIDVDGNAITKRKWKFDNFTQQMIDDIEIDGIINISSMTYTSFLTDKTK